MESELLSFNYSVTGVKYSAATIGILAVVSDNTPSVIMITHIFNFCTPGQLYDNASVCCRGLPVRSVYPH